jgi:malonyl CoA-acyl carrier protein transacylase
MNVFKRIWSAVRGVATSSELAALDEAHNLRNRLQYVIAGTERRVKAAEAAAQAELADLRHKLTEAEATIADLRARGGNIIRDRLR